MARISPTAVILAGPFWLHGPPFPTLFAPEAMTWLKALNIGFVHPSSLGKQGEAQPPTSPVQFKK